MGGWWHPWRYVRSLTSVHVHWQHLPGDQWAATDRDRIVLDPRLTQVERREYLTHELIHHDRGDTCRQDASTEALVWLRTAHLLIPLDQLVDVTRWTDHVDEAADELWVTPALLRRRLEHLHPAEHARVAAARAERHG